MHRRKFLQSTAALGGVLLLPQHAWLQSVLPVKGNFELLRDNIYLFTERGGSVACLLTPEHSVVVDTQFPEQAGHLIDRIREVNSKPLDLLVNTHHHGDHTAGNIAFKDMVTTHVAHANSRANQERVAREREQMAELLLPETTYTSEWSQKVGDETVQLHYLGAGHTDGDSFVHFQNANVVHTGDLMFNRRFPFIDKSAGANIGNWIEVLDRARKLFDKDTLYVFGHAGEGHTVTGSADDLKVMAHFLKKSLRFVKQAYRKGRTLDELLETVIEIPGAPEYQGKGIERVLKAAWAEVTA